MKIISYYIKKLIYNALLYYLFAMYNKTAEQRLKIRGLNFLFCFLMFRGFMN